MRCRGQWRNRKGICAPCNREKIHRTLTLKSTDVFDQNDQWQRRSECSRIPTDVSYTVSFYSMAIDHASSGRCTAQPTTVTINDTQCTIEIWDTPGQDFSHLEGLSDFSDSEEELVYAYTLADIFIICFAVCDPESFEQARDRVSHQARRGR